MAGDGAKVPREIGGEEMSEVEGRSLSSGVGGEGGVTRSGLKWKKRLEYRYTSSESCSGSGSDEESGGDTLLVPPNTEADYCTDPDDPSYKLSPASGGRKVEGDVDGRVARWLRWR